MNATRDQIIELLNDGLTNTAIGKRLSCDRHRVADIRRELGLANVPQQPLTLEEKWAAFTRPTASRGHLEWTGERQRTSGTPVLRYREQAYTAAQIAFRIQYGREPQGYVLAGCELHHCVAPAHVEDEAMRTRVREQVRYLGGGRARKAKCVHGHDLAVHGRHEADGVAYCRACKNARKGVPA